MVVETTEDDDVADLRGEPGGPGETLGPGVEDEVLVEGPGGQETLGGGEVVRVTRVIV